MIPEAKPLWLRDLDRSRAAHLGEVLDTVGDLICPWVYRDIRRNIGMTRNPPLIHNGGKP